VAVLWYFLDGPMRRLRALLLVGFGFCFLGEPALGAITAEPDALVLSTTENRPITRTLTLSSDTDIRQLAIAASDLDRTDHSALLPAEAIDVQLPQTFLPAGELLQIPITLDPRQARANGEFTGSLWITYDGIQQTIPITLRTKDPIALPLIVLLAGVALGSTLAWYRTRGLPQDELIVRMGQLRTQMRTDLDLETIGRRFHQQIEASLIDAEAALGLRNWDAARASLEQAEAIWIRWRRGREDWLLQIQYLQMLHQHTTEPPLKQTAYGQQMQAALEDVERRIAEFETPQALREALLPLRDSLNRFREGEALMEHIARLETRMKDDDRRRYWGTQRERLEAELSRLPPQEPDAYAHWKADVEQQQTGMVADLQQQENPQSQGADVEAIARNAMAQVQPQGLPLVPGVGFVATEQGVRSARSRLRLFRLVSQAVAILFLSWAGLSELYEGNPTFGASPIGDYLVLAAWGFGAEVTRDSIVKAVQELNNSSHNDIKPLM